MDKSASLAERRGYNNGLEAAAIMVEQGGALALHGKMAAAIRARKVEVTYPPVEEQVGLVPQLDLIRRAPDPVDHTTDAAQLNAWGLMPPKG